VISTSYIVMYSMSTAPLDLDCRSFIPRCYKCHAQCRVKELLYPLRHHCCDRASTPKNIMVANCRTSTDQYIVKFSLHTCKDAEKFMTYIIPLLLLWRRLLPMHFIPTWPTPELHKNHNSTTTPPTTRPKFNAPMLALSSTCSSLSAKCELSQQI